MQIAVLADIHGNLQALQAVLDDLIDVAPDSVIVAGDFQNRGPQSREVTDLLFTRGWPLLRGNHEDYVLRQSEGFDAADVADYYSWLPARWTAGVTRDWLAPIRELPIALTVSGPDGRDILIAHGSPRSNAETVFPSTSEAAIRNMLGATAPAVFCCGHSHLPLQRQVGSTLVFNVGSVGFPFDGDQRAAYGLLTFRHNRWQGELRRIAYPIVEVLTVFAETNFYENVGPLAHIIRRELESARPHMTAFYHFFGPLLRSGELSIFAAVEAYLSMSQAVIEEQYLALRKRRA